MTMMTFFFVHLQRIFFGIGVVVVIVSAATVAATTRGSEDISMDLKLRFTEEPEDVVVLHHDSVMLNCSVTGSDNNGSDVEVVWRKDGKDVASDGHRRLVLPGGALLIRRVALRSDEGTYECVARSGTSALVSRQAHLQVAVVDHFSGHPRSLTVAEGENARFECKIDGVPKPYVVWQKNGKSVHLSDRFVQLSSSHVMQILNVTTSDAGNYCCVAIGLGEERTSNGAALRINSGNFEDIRFLARPQDQEAIADDTVVFECLLSSPADVVWLRKDGLALPKNRVRILGDSNLEIRNVEEEDSGVYSCNVAGITSLSVDAKLSVLVSPMLNFSSGDMVQPRAQTVWMMCNFVGVPTPQVTWFKNGQPVRRYGRIRVEGEMLTIGQSTDSDTAIYQCWGENAAGRTGAAMSLFITSSGLEPEPPSELRATTIDSRKIGLNWSLSHGNGMIVGYSIHYWRLLGGEETQFVERNPPTVISGLLPHTNYSIYIRAYGGQGASRHSAYVIQATSEDVPVMAPDVQVYPSSQTSLMVSWQELPPERARGTVVQYKIFYRRHEDRSSSLPVVVQLPGDVFEYEIDELDTDEIYDVRVLAGTKMGFPTLNDDVWPWISQVVSAEITLSNVNMFALNATAIKLTWSIMQHVPGLNGFQIHFKLSGAGDEELRTITVLEDIAEHTIFGLKSDSVYEVSIAAFTDYEDGKVYHQMIRTPPDDTKGRVLRITEAKAINVTAIRVSWTIEPHDDQKEISFYTLSYGLASDDDAEAVIQEKSVNSTETHLIVSGLRPFVSYRFTVKGRFLRGSGSTLHGKEPVVCQTEEGRPPGLQELTWFLQEPTVVQLNWKMPQRSNGVVSLYVVSYCEESSPNHNWQTRIENGSICHTILQGLKTRTIYQVKMHAENRKGPGPASKIKVTTGMLPDDNDRLMGIIIGVCISGGCIAICILIILLRNRCIPPARAVLPAHHANGCATALHSNGYVSNCHHDDQGNGQEPDGTTPMLNHSQEFDGTDNKMSCQTSVPEDLKSSDCDRSQELLKKMTTTSSSSSSVI